MNFLNVFFAAMHIAETVDNNRLATDQAYRESLIAELCGLQKDVAPTASAELPADNAEFRHAA